MNTMLFLAVSALDKLKQVPPSLWWKAVLGMVGFLVLIVVLKRLMQVNKVLLTIATLVISALVFFSWVYHRNEPAFLTPLVDRLAPFFPSAGAYESQQQKDPTQPDQPRRPTPTPQPPQPATPASHVY
ncbi:MAG TPA: hypothetical protein VK785_02920 [Opitutaceae bacterium]|jgi:hypothetical protein|nr:hypothetical protein [Opitutaceae bacterium]